MKVDGNKVDDVLVLDISGRIMGDASMEMRREINGWIAEIPDETKPKVVLNLSKITMMDSAGLGALVSSYTSVQKREGRLVLAGLGRGLQNLIAITKLARVFDVYETEEEAVKSFSEA